MQSNKTNNGYEILRLIKSISAERNINMEQFVTDSGVEIRDFLFALFDQSPLEEIEDLIAITEKANHQEDSIAQDILAKLKERRSALLGKGANNA